MVDDGGSDAPAATAAGRVRTMIAAGRRRLRLACFALSALLCCSGAAPAAADGPIVTRFEVFGFAGVHVLTMRGRTDESGGDYTVSLDYVTDGLAKLFVDLTTLAEVSGRLVDGVPQPVSFRSDTVRNGVARHNHIDYHPDGMLGVTVLPAPPDPVAPDRTRGTIDNLTAYFRLEHQLATTGNCNMTARVFDGRHAYDLVFTNAGQQALMPAGGQDFTGTTLACRMVRHAWPGVADPEQDEGAQDGTIWYARVVPGDLLVPVRTRMDTQLGVVEGYLAELHGRGANLNLLH